MEKMIKRLSLPEFIDNNVISTEYLYIGTQVYCTLTLKSRYRVTGYYNFFKLSSYDKEIGEKESKKNAYTKLEELADFYIKQSTHEIALHVKQEREEEWNNRIKENNET